MELENLCSRDVKIVDVATSIEHVAIGMRNSHIDKVVVVEKQNQCLRPVGVITERDIILHVIAAGKSPSDVQARMILTRPVVKTSIDSSVEKAIRLMQERCVTCLVLVNSEDEVCGTISYENILKNLYHELGALKQAIKGQYELEKQFIRESSQLNYYQLAN